MRIEEVVMKLLLIGGTGFLSSHIAEIALQRGHTITIFHRGTTNAERFPEVEKILGDRATDIELLQGRQWDAVIDICGYIPRIVRASAELLVKQVKQYVFISTLNVYGEVQTEGLDETYPLATIDDPTTEERTPELYGPLKALCEEVVQQVFAERALIIRPGLIVGPRDASERFTYWPHRLARGGEVLAPDNKEQPAQFIDVRDLATWTLSMVENQQSGIYNADGLAYQFTLQQVLERCRVICNKEAIFTWVSEAFLEEHDVKPWMELPLWILSAWGTAMCTVNVNKAVQAGLTFRSLDDTIRDTLAWDQTRPPEQPRGQTLTPEREAELLREWHTLHTLT
jgi:2'-hydroxyisoflavone reductase